MSDDVPPRVTDDVICAPKCKECQCVSISFYLKNVFFFKLRFQGSVGNEKVKKERKGC